MKWITTLLAMFMFLCCLSQDFKPYEIERLNSFGIQLKSNTWRNESYAIDFRTILEKESKRRTRKTFGIVFAAIGSLSTGFGILVLSNKSENGEGKAFQETIGGMFVGAGVITGGMSIPLFNSARKKRKERDNLIEKYTLK